MKALVSFVCALAILLVVLPGPLYKWHILDLSTAFTGIRFGVYAGVAGLVLLAVQLLFMRKNINWLATIVSAVFAIVAVAMPLSLMNKAKGVPPIHDISTDVAAPPEFVAIAAIRVDAPNPVEYAGAETAAQQLKAYPELVTLKYTDNTKTVFGVAKNAVEQLGWELVSADPSQGIIEATDTTAWFGFKDDVVIRIKSKQGITLVDVRSKSRVGKSDLGKNAARIHEFIEQINPQLTAI
ncbi:MULTISPECIES: DUF1499 domain-containing protein [Pseudoalteromonas]|uniref:DUF1499 domain-containing protein n=1 Tax=Pseudoalteromonas TaxID=53246 RepID=UPI0002D37618|nr:MULTISPECIES: DUF1499 domain-containing protein [Pseudoalteromonas]MCF6144672.1 hypothetical protein [Pseudoalteromonas mariniglutinosa NCIMB 1770]TMN74697.1 DUF1499 domain-containing protein [Pseudoalteromonas sp. S1727]